MAGFEVSLYGRFSGVPRGFQGQRFVVHDRDTKFCDSLWSMLRAGGVEPVRLPSRSPNLNAFPEPWVPSVKEECLWKLILVGEGSLRRALNEYVAHFHKERRNIRGREMSCSSRSRFGLGMAPVVLKAGRVWAAYSGITASSHEYFDHMGSVLASLSMRRGGLNRRIASWVIDVPGWSDLAGPVDLDEHVRYRGLSRFNRANLVMLAVSQPKCSVTPDLLALSAENHNRSRSTNHRTPAAAMPIEA